MVVLTLKRCILAVPLLLGSPYAHGQNVMEDIIEQLEGEEAPSEWLEFLMELLEHPMDINDAPEDALAQLPAISPLLAQQIVAFRHAYGPFEDLAELLAVEGLFEDILERISPFLHVRKDAPARAPGRWEIMHRTGRRLELSKGYLPQDEDGSAPYLGSPYRVYTRVRMQRNTGLSLNMTLSKDPGEPMGWNPASHTYVYDYTSAHAVFKDLGHFRSLVIGDYTASFGQGLTLWRSSGMGKGRDPVAPVQKKAGGIRPSVSASDRGVFRGVAATAGWSTVEMTAFASRRRLGATLSEPDPLTGIRSILSRKIDGLHRTPSELSRKHATTESVVGGNVQYRFNNGSTGISFYGSHFSHPFAISSQAYRRYSFAGQTAVMAGFHAEMRTGALQWFGETARAPAGVFGGIAGVTSPLGPGTEAVFLFRQYPAAFVSLYGHGFGDRNGATQNEAGFYSGVKIRLSRRMTFSSYFDQFSHPWLRFTVPSPTSGHDFMATLAYRPHGYVQFRSTIKEAGSRLADENGRLVSGITPELRQMLRLHGEHRPGRNLRLAGRIEIRRFTEGALPARSGILLFQDVRWQPVGTLQLDARMALFDTEGYDARVYMYENDLLYVFALPAFSGQGQRSYVLLRYMPAPHIDVWIKYAWTVYEDVRSTGSGLDEIAGNRQRDLRAQIRIRL